MSFPFCLRADRDCPLTLLGGAKDPFLFSFCYFNQTPDEEGGAVAMRKNALVVEGSPSVKRTLQYCLSSVLYRVAEI